MRWISLFFLSLAATAAAASSAELNATRANAIHHYLSARNLAHTFSGVVLVAQGDHILLERGYGNANYEDHVANTPSTVFRIASITKPLVASSALSLAASGRLDLDASLCSILAKCPDLRRRLTQLITVRVG
jgi:CubicO group peptidase (beta-lactamase class C family)